VREKVVARIFISYHRKGDQQQGLALRLVSAFTARGHRAFIDVGMPVGTDWAQQIRAELVSSDFCVVLLSETSIAREMVQAEVRIARQAQRENGRPRILPVRVRYPGALDYELEAYIGRLNYSTWDSPADDAALISSLLAAIDGHEPTAPPVPPAPAPTTGIRPASSAPTPSADPRIRVAPGGTVAPDDPLCIAREFDARVRLLASIPGQSIVFKAPRQRGKSTALCQYMAACQSFNRPVAMQQIIQQRTAEANLSRRLEAAGLVRERDGVYVPSNLVYARFFRSAR